ncbi:MAG: hypothetical protein K5705_04675 [Oscillospiraceae bacterium]|nr:hypothetical protein [Oscillospiraceae bacterium]
MPDKNAQAQSQREAEIAAQQKREEAARAAQPTEAKPEKLLPFLNTAKERYTTNIADLNAKRTVQQDKITQNEEKIECLTSKADRLSATNDMMKRLTAGTFLEAAADAIIARNQKRIDKIEKKQIPNAEKKIAEHEKRIEALDRKIEMQQRKADKCTALSNVITSFVIMDPAKRRAQFSQAMDTLNRVTKESLEAKLDRCTDRNAVLQKRLQSGKLTQAQAKRVGTQISKNLETIHQVEAKLSKLEALTLPYAQQPPAHQDLAQADAERRITDAVQSGEVRVNPLAETISVDVAELAADRAREAIQLEAAKLVAAMSPQEKKDFMNRADAYKTRTPTPVEIAVFEMLAAEEKAQARPAQAAPQQGFVLSRQKRTAMADRAAQAQHQPARTDRQNQQHDLE